ncbi:maleate cis-trans isomerase family protein [Oricola cellulosilytica]|uniref:Asp/Glu racemase n=1 Tax=Oricola cellulosilytica TaxID=1429082 RepID=A0A4R0PBP6_9HYPH|nr:aspartate/glutamate racemase family protein [Oricola cellulosilytica]TCD14466.1 Asp/Glu racemase [Oricola cellulosilytica]
MKLGYHLDREAAPNGVFGVVVLQSDETLERELSPLFAADGAALHHTRIPFADAVNPETLRQMRRDLPSAVALFPSETPFDVIAYGCTSGATMIGSAEVEAAIHSIKPDAKVTNPVAAVLAACEKLGARRLGFLTPYLPPVSRAMRELLEGHGLEVTAFGSFEQESDRAVARISRASVIDAIREIDARGQVDAVFASCTNLRTFGLISEAEAAIGKPLITSNQALAWHMFSLAGLALPSNGPGRLFRV